MMNAVMQSDTTLRKLTPTWTHWKPRWSDTLEAENAELQKTPNELRRVLAEVRTENAKLQDALLRIKYSFAKGPGQRFGLADARAIAHAALEDTHE
jgi:hypothetical protein